MKMQLAKCLSVLLFLSYMSRGFAQSVTQLDQKNGLKDFILGTPAEDYYKYDPNAMKGAKLQCLLCISRCISERSGSYY